jgi:hypothetical protein
MSVEYHGGVISTGEKLLILAPELSGIPTSSHLVAKKEDLAKEILNLAFEVSLFILRRVL